MCDSLAALSLERIYLAAMRSLLLTSFLLFCFCSNAFADTNIKLGVPLPLSGDATTYGTDIKNSLLFANQRIANGAYQFIFEDDRCSAKDGVRAARKLINVDKVRYALGFACSSSVLGPAPIYEQNKVIAITSSAASSKISEAGDYIFRTYPNNASGAKILFDYLSTKHQHIGIISEETDFAQDYSQTLIRLNSDNQLKITEENVLPEVTDFRPALLRLKNKGVEAIIFNPQTEAGLIRLVDQSAQLNLNVARYANILASSPTFLKEVGSLANGIIFNDVPPVNELVDANGVNLYKEFVEEYGEPISSDLLFVTTYVAFEALHEAISKDKDVQEYLANNTFSGLIGDYSFDTNGDISGLNQVLKVIDKLKPMVMKQ